jgi:hypothetical protein
MLGWHPHVHAIATRGGWDAEGCFMPMAFVSTTAAERLFRHRVIVTLRDAELLSEERIELLLSWRHSGFSVHNAVTVAPGDREGIERLARYLLRSPVSLERLRFDEEARSASYRPKDIRAGRGEETFEGTELLARLLQHVPEARLHQVRYYGYYSNVARAKREAKREGAQTRPSTEETAAADLGATERRRLRRSWAQLIRRVYEVDPLTCTECGGEMRILAFLLDPAAVRQILDHLAGRRDRARGPPAGLGVRAATSR